MKVKLRVVDDRSRTPIPWWGYAGVEWDAENATIYILRGHVTAKRVGHELAHIVDRHQGSRHHSWWHFCLRVVHGLRTWDHVDGVDLQDVEALVQGFEIEEE